MELPHKDPLLAELERQFRLLGSFLGGLAVELPSVEVVVFGGEHPLEFLGRVEEDEPIPLG